MPETQALALASKLPPPRLVAGDGARVIIPSELQLTLEQEERLLNHARDRFQTISNELGRADFEGESWRNQGIEAAQKSCASFFGRRHLSHLIFQQRMDWRAWILGGLYAESNVHLPITARIVNQQIARAQKSFFGTTPFFAVSGLSADSDILAEDLNAFARHQLDTIGGMQSSLSAAIELAFVQGETAVKTRRHKLTSYFESYREVAVNPATRQPFIAQDGDYIYKTDLFALDEASGKMLLKRDGKTEQPLPDMQGTFQTVKINLAQVLADRVESRPIHFTDFLCPLVADVQSADTVIHLYNAQVIEMADKYLRDMWGDMPPEDQLGRISELVHALLPGTSSTQQATADQARSELGEAAGSTGRDRSEPYVGLAECWMWFDPFGDGVQRSIMLLMDQSGRLPIYYNYAGNLTPDGLRPFDIVRINNVPGRWHGQGNVEQLYNLQEQADLLLNRALFAESRAARVDFWDPSQTKEGQQDPNLKLNWGRTYTLKETATADKALKSVYLENIKSANLKDLLQTILQMAQNYSGVSNVNDGAMAGMDTAKLATGIKNLERSGEEMFHKWLSQLTPDLESICRRALRVLILFLASPDGQAKLFKFFDRISQKILEIDVTRLADLDLDIKLDLTTYKSQAQLQSAQMGYNMAADFLGRPPHHQKRLAPLVRQFLRALEVRSADEITAEFTPEELALAVPPPGAPTAGLPTPANPDNLPI